MAVLDIAAIGQQSKTHNIFNTSEAINTLCQLDITEQTKLINQQPFKQAKAILGQTPIGDVQEILEKLEELGFNLRVRELSADFGMMISTTEPTQDYLNAGVM